jgi:RNA polymerase sigma factor (sigma-70 family)
MASGRMRGVVRELRQRALSNSSLTDGELLERYLAGREDAAFAALVRRHGPMVLAVCRRIVRDPHDADDAFQATFLVLVRRAASIKPCERVGAWLYGVAYRTALKAKAMSQRRRSKQQPLADVPAPPLPGDSEWLALLDREIQRLPDKYRLPIVLCDLEGKTRKQAAATLGWPEGTVATRLRDGRALVQKRLARHGLAVTGAAATFAWGQALSAITVPAPLCTTTIQLASVFASGKAAGLVPLNILALAEGVLQAMMVTKLKNATALVALVALLGAGLHGLSGQGVPAVDATPVEQRQAPDTPAPIVPPAEAALEENNGKLPTTPPPVQALVSIDKDKVIVRTNQPVYRRRQVVDSNGQSRTMYEVAFMLRRDRYERSEVEVSKAHDKERRTFADDEIATEEMPALIVYGKGNIDPLHLRLIKEGTLIVALPAIAAPMPDGPPVPVMQYGAAWPAVPAFGPHAPAVVPRPALVPQPMPVMPPKEKPSETVRRADKLFERGDRLEALRLYQFVHQENRKTITSLIACQRIWRCVQSGDPKLRDVARAAAKEAVKNAIADLETMSVEDRSFTGAGVWTRQDWQQWLLWVSGQLMTIDSAARVTHTPPAIHRDATIPEAESDMEAAAFYLKAGKRDSAAFYYELVCRRWPGTMYAERAAAVLQELRRQDTAVPAAPAPVRIGQIFIIGNKNAILKPGDVKAPIRFEDRARGFGFTADELKVLPGNRVLLTEGELWKQPKNGAPERIQGKRVLLTLDAPLRSIEDFSVRTIVEIRIEGN